MIRPDLIFSYWIYLWYILYIFKVVKYNPKLAIICGMIENLVIFLLMCIYNTKQILVVLFIIMFVILKLMAKLSNISAINFCFCGAVCFFLLKNSIFTFLLKSPCFDEPAYKATYDFAIDHPIGTKALFNTDPIVTFFLNKP